MRERILVLIFFFWAVLTIVTPTLILLSESSKPQDFLDYNAEQSEGLKARRMVMGYAQNLPRKEIASAPMEAPTPAPLPEPVSGVGEAILTRQTILRV